MKKITAITPQKRNMDRVNVYLDDAFAFGLAAKLARSLAIGHELSEEDVERLQQQDEYQVSLQLAYEQIARRPRTEREIKEYLEKKGRGNAADAVISRLQELQYVDDAAFARQWIDNRSAFRPRSSGALRCELRQKGVSSEMIEDALEDFDEKSAALAAARTASRKYRNNSPEKFRKKLYGYLSRRGFPYEEIRAAVEQIMSERAQQDADSEA